MGAGATGTPAEAPDPTQVLDTSEAGGKAIRGSALRAGGYAASAVLALASAPLLFRHLGVVDFGRYTTVLSLVAIVAGVTEAGLGAVALREYIVRTGTERERFMRTVLGARLVLSVAGVAVACLFAAVSGYGSTLVLGTALAGLGMVVAVYQGTLFIPFGAGLRYGWITIGDILRSAAAVALVIALVLGGSGIVGFLAVPVPVNIGLLILTVFLVRGTMPFRPSFHLGQLTGLLRETLPLAVAAIVSTLYFRIVMILMSLIASAYQTGLFATSYRIIEVLNGLPALLIAATFPILSRAARDDDARLGYALQRIFEVAVIGGVLISLATIIGADVAMDFIGGAEAAPAADVLRVQAIALVPITLTLTWTHGLLSLHRHRALLIANAVGLAAVVALTAALVPFLDAVGGAIAVAIAECALALTAALLVRRARGSVIESAAVVPKTAAAAAAGAAVALLLSLPDLVEVVLAVGVYAGVLLALRAIPTELRSAFSRPAG